METLYEGLTYSHMQFSQHTSRWRRREGGQLQVRKEALMQNMGGASSPQHHHIRSEVFCVEYWYRVCLGRTFEEGPRREGTQ
jgi:hypothetical protein